MAHTGWHALCVRTSASRERQARLFVDALNYRKSFAGRIGPDFDLARALALNIWLLSRTVPRGRATHCASSAALSLVRSIDLLPDTVPTSHAGISGSIGASAAAAGKADGG